LRHILRINECHGLLFRHKTTELIQFMSIIILIDSFCLWGKHPISPALCFLEIPKSNGSKFKLRHRQ
jgi:hypothetical protein